MADADRQPRMYGDLSELWPFVSPPEHYEEEVATFVARFRRHGVPDGASILHLGSGGGSIDWHLARLYEVTGVDRSGAMIRHASSLNPGVTYLEGDLRTIRLGRRFDAVLLHDAIAYMTSVQALEEAYATAAAHLAPGGVLVTIPEQLRDTLRLGRTRISVRRRGDREVTLYETDHDADPRDHVFETVFVFVIRESGTTRVEADLHINGVFELDEFLGALDRAGFDARAEPWELTDWESGEAFPLITAIRR